MVLFSSSLFDRNVVQKSKLLHSSIFNQNQFLEGRATIRINESFKVDKISIIIDHR